METKRSPCSKKDKKTEKKATRRKPEREPQNCAEPHESDRASPLSNGLTWRVQS